MKRFTAILIALFVLTAVALLSAASAVRDDITIIFTGGIDDSRALRKLCRCCGCKKELEADYGDSRVTLVDLGDTLGLSTFGALSQGEYTVELMDLVGYDLAVPGEMEFAYGVERLRELADRTGFAYLSCNFTDLRTGMDVLPPYEIISYGSVSVGYIGITSPDIMGNIDPELIKDTSGKTVYGFCQGDEGEELYTKVQQVVDTVKAAGANYIVAMGHLGNSESDSWSAETLIANINGLDVLIDGHAAGSGTETIYDENGDEVVLVESDSSGSAGVVTIAGKTGRIAVSFIDEWEEDAETAEKILEIRDRYSRVLSKVAAVSESSLLAETEGDSADVRNSETNLGDLYTDAFRAAGQSDAAIMTGGSVCGDIEAGYISYGEIISTLSSSGALCKASVTGTQLLGRLGDGSYVLPGEERRISAGLRDIIHHRQLCAFLGDSG